MNLYLRYSYTINDQLDGAKRYRKVSEKEGNQCKIVTYEGQGHGFFNYKGSGNKHYDLTLKEMDSFLVDLGWLPSN